MDRAIQRQIRRAEESGDPERIKEAHKLAQESYGMGTGIIVGSVIGTILLPGLGSYIGAGIGAFLGHKIGGK
ncbi:hypothetical protein KKH15_00855 [Patescibacteria group bacterium]|nr:hypothetical protein [Patescibacteria group bacterium]MBU1755168.1 hypothetical protein [Patescibacteria group bacterium]